jgi:hypothetical protein
MCQYEKLVLQCPPLLKTGVCLFFLLFIAACDSRKMNLDEDLSEWREQNQIMQVPEGWRKSSPLGQSAISWSDPNTYSNIRFRGHGAKDRQLLDDGSIIEKDVFFSGRRVKHPDPEAGQVAEELNLIYVIREGVIVERKAYTTLAGFISYELGITLALEWTSDVP